MHKLTVVQKDAILRHINSIPNNIIKNFIVNKALTIEECKEWEIDKGRLEEILKEIVEDGTIYDYW